MSFYNALRAVAMKGLEEIIGGIALILLAGSLLIVYGHALGVVIW